MTKLITKFSITFENSLKSADEIWVAVALMNLKGYNFIQESIPKRNCKQNYIVGVDLPTDPAVLSKLLALQIKDKFIANVLTKGFFHPKVYIVKTKNKLKAFVGSANCTNGGFEKNIEMMVEISDRKACKGLIDWFNATLGNSEPLTDAFIKEYKPKYDKRLVRKKQDQNEISNFKKKQEEIVEAYFKNKQQLIRKLKAFRKSSDYQIEKKKRHEIIKKIKIALDDPNFRNLDLKFFFSWEARPLGTIRPIVKSIIERNPNKFAQLMKYICDDSISLRTRIDEAKSGKLSIPFIGNAFISKVLTIHKPQEYYVHNNVLIQSLKPFGLTYQRGTFGERYEATRDALRELMKKANIDDFAILDFYLYKLLNK